MDIDHARAYIRDNHHAVMATYRADGRPQLSPVVVGLDDDGTILLSTRESAYKTRNLRRDPRVALSLTAADNPFEPIVIRGRVVEWLEGDEAWEVVDRIAAKYIGGPYPRDEERVVAVVEPERQSVGVG